MDRNILIIDDDPEITEALQLVLTVEGFSVASAHTGMQGLHIARTDKPDLIIMDLGLPDIDGQQLCKAILKEHDFPLIVLSARDSVAEKVLCLEYGADDYITKPFESVELIARIQSVLRRAAPQKESNQNSHLEVFSLNFDLKNQRVFKDKQMLELTPKEYELLVFLAKNPGKLLERETIVTALWGKNSLYKWSRSLDVHIQHLRQKIEPNPKNPHYIQTVSGVGYKINP